jgi:hypothetical protein
MPKVTNTSQVNVELVTGVKDGQLQLHALRPGQTDTVDFDAKNPRNQTLLHVGAIRVEGKTAAAAAVPATKGKNGH